MEMRQNSELYLKRATRVATACSKSVGTSVKVGKIRQSLLLLALLQVEELAFNWSLVGWAMIDDPLLF